MQLRIFHEINFTHPALANLRADFVAAQTCANKSHNCDYGGGSPMRRVRS